MVLVAVINNLVGYWKAIQISGVDHLFVSDGPVMYVYKLSMTECKLLYKKQVVKPKKFLS